jgi:nitrate/nitrite transporter NarK
MTFSLFMIIIPMILEALIHITIHQAIRVHTLIILVATILEAVLIAPQVETVEVEVEVETVEAVGDATKMTLQNMFSRTYHAVLTTALTLPIYAQSALEKKVEQTAGSERMLGEKIGIEIVIGLFALSAGCLIYDKFRSKRKSSNSYSSRNSGSSDSSYYSYFDSGSIYGSGGDDGGGCDGGDGGGGGGDCGGGDGGGGGGD